MRTGFEPVNPALKGRCVNRFTNARYGVGKGNRTPIFCLEGKGPTVERYPHNGHTNETRTRIFALRGRLPNLLEDGATSTLDRI